ncbi:MAG: PAS domain-containing protein, partial [Thermoanaerobaculia bacterium]
SEERLQLAQRAAGIGHYSWDLQTNITTRSDEMSVLYGLPPGSLGGKHENWSERIFPDDLPAVEAQIQKSLISGELSQYFRVVWPDASIHWLLARGKVFFSEDGKPLRMVGVNMDITERMRTGEALRRSEEALKEAQRVAHVGHWEWSPATGATMWSDETYRILGIPIGSVTPSYELFVSMINPQDRRTFEDEFARVLNSSGDGDGDIDLRITTPAGDARVISQRTSVERDVAGNVVRVHGSYQDITRRVATERALRESEAGYRGLFAANPHPMWVYDLETLAFLEVNDAAVAHYGYRRDEFEAMSIEDIRPSEDVPRLLANISTAGNQTIDTAGTWKHRTKDGAIIDVEITSHVLDYGGRRAELVLAHDITERMRIEEALKKSEAALKEAQRDAQVGHWEWSALTGATTWSDEVYRILGIPIGSATPSYELLFGIIDLKGRHRIEKEIARAIGSSSDLDGVVDMDLPITTPAGTALVVSHRAFVDRDAAGNVVGFHGTCQDITRRVEMEHALRDSEASLAEAQQIAHVGSAIVYVKSGEIHASDEYFRIFDLEPRPGTPINVFLERIHEEDRGAVKAALN